MEQHIELIHWKDSFNTGFARVDLQHQELVNLINELYAQLQGKDDTHQQLGSIFSKLSNYAADHFSMEETFMKEFAYEGYTAHKEEHTKFIEKITELKDKFLHGDSSVKTEVLNFLKDWLLTHIIGTDKITFISIDKKIHNA